MKEQKEVKFKVVYTPAIATKLGEFMSKLGLGISGIEAPACYNVSWITSKKIDKKYIDKMSEALKQSLENQGITQIHLIEYLTK